MENLIKVSELTHEAFSYFQDGCYKEHLYKSNSGKYFGVYLGGPRLHDNEEKDEEGFILVGSNVDVVLNLRPAYYAGIDYNERPAESPEELDKAETKPVYYRDFPPHVQRVLMDYARGNRGESGVVEYTEAEAIEWLEYENQKS